MEFNSIHEMYFKSALELKSRGKFVESVTDDTSIGSNFGTRKRDFIELEGYNFKLLNPRNRIIYSRTRRLSMGFNIANFIWLMSGSKSVEPISFYNKKGRIFSNNGEYYEAAFGDRLFGTYKLIDSASELLTSDLTTRRALIPLFFPNDLIDRPRDTPCASSIQLLIRDNQLDFFLNMRSQSLLMVFPYDIFIFTMLHEYLSLLYNKELGVFNYNANSFHYYLDEQKYLDNLLNEDFEDSIKPMRKMPSSTLEELPKLFVFEEYLRNTIKRKSIIDEKRIKEFSHYWQELLQLMCSKALAENDIDQNECSSAYLENDKIYF